MWFHDRLIENCFCFDAGRNQGDHRGHAGEVGGARQDDGGPLLRSERRRGPHDHGRAGKDR